MGLHQHGEVVLSEIDGVIDDLEKLFLKELDRLRKHVRYTRRNSITCAHCGLRIRNRPFYVRTEQSGHSGGGLTRYYFLHEHCKDSFVVPVVTEWPDWKTSL
jgi:hypothetical protein